MRSLQAKAGLYSSFVAVCALFAQVANAQRSHLAVEQQDGHLLAFLKEYLRDPREGADTTTRISLAFVRRNDHTIEEVVVYVTGQTWCGSGGCRLLMLQPHDSSFDVIGSATIVWPPITLLNSTTNGHHDISVRVHGGGILPGYDAILEFDGGRYPGNPTDSTIRRLGAHARGIVLIAVGHDSQPLFP
jgi:hypothetical protein